MGIVELLGLHNMVVREPFEFSITFVDRCWMQTDALVVRDVSVSLAILQQDPRIETPGND